LEQFHQENPIKAIKKVFKIEDEFS
jgi:hypothetical protein